MAEVHFTRYGGEPWKKMKCWCWLDSLLTVSTARQQNDQEALNTYSNDLTANCQLCWDQATQYQPNYDPNETQILRCKTWDTFGHWKKHNFWLHSHSLTTSMCSAMCAQNITLYSCKCSKAKQELYFASFQWICNHLTMMQGSGELHQINDTCWWDITLSTHMHAVHLNTSSFY